ncbi:MAG: hypothetical protein H6619_06240 [Deltaproteobacteria bacterium]|nr:hypothetical protein [Deltaproteobacteria bacterium]
MFSIFKLSLLAQLLLLSLTSFSEQCSYTQHTDKEVGEVQIIEGFYTSSFELSGFTPCGESETVSWWLEPRSAQSRLSSEIKKLGGTGFNPPDKRLYLKAKACVSPDGTYGHLGMFPRHVEIIQLIAVHPEESSDCGN